MRAARLAIAIATALGAAGPGVAPATELRSAEIESHFEAGMYDEVISEAEATLAQDDPRRHYWLARAHYELGDYLAAIEAAERAVELEPQSSEYHVWLGRSLGRRAEEVHSFTLARAVKREFLAAVEADPDSVLARRDLMQFYVEAPFIVGGSKSKAREQAAAIEALDPVAGHLAWASYLRHTRDPDAAAERYQRMLALEPPGADPYFEMAEFGEEIADAATIERALAAASEGASSDPRLDYYRGVALVLRGADPARGRSHLEAYLAGAPRSSELPTEAQAQSWLERSGGR